MPPNPTVGLCHACLSSAAMSRLPLIIWRRQKGKWQNSRPAIDKQLVETVSKYARPENAVLVLDDSFIPCMAGFRFFANRVDQFPNLMYKFKYFTAFFKTVAKNQ